MYLAGKCATICLLAILMTGSQGYSDIATYWLDRILQTSSSTSVDLSPDGTTILARDLVVETGVEGFTTFDAHSYAMKRWYPIGAMQAPWRGLFSADSNYFYATSYYGGAVKKIQLSTGNQVASIYVGSWPYQMAFDSQRRFLYVEQGCPGGGAGIQGSIKVIDTTTDSVVGTVGLNGEPSGSIVAPGDDFLYVMSRRSSAHTLYKIRTSDLQVVGALAMTASTLEDRGFSLSPDGGTAYLPDPSGNGVHVVNTTNMTETDVWSVSGVGGFFVSPDGTHALVAPPAGQTMRVFDLPSRTVVQSLNLGSSFDGRWTPYWDWDGGLGRVFYPVGGVAVLIPEPATLSLLALGGLALMLPRRK